MWNKKIEGFVTRAISGTIYSVWGGVGYSTLYIDDTHQFEVLIWDKSIRFDDRKVVAERVFDISNSNEEYEVSHTLVSDIEKWIIENYS